MGMPVPRAFAADVEMILNTDARNLLTSEELDVEAFNRLNEETRLWGIELDQASLGFLASQRGNAMLSALERSATDLILLGRVQKTIAALVGSGLPVNLWKMQNIFYRMVGAHYEGMRRRAAEGDRTSAKWVGIFQELGRHLDVVVES
jgi:hypothetical protein